MAKMPNRMTPRPTRARHGGPPAGPPVPRAAADAEPSRPDADAIVSDVLRTVHLSGAMLFLVEASRPWRSEAPAAERFRRAVLPSAQHLISFHIVVQGHCWGGLVGDHPLPLAPGDVLVVPHGDAYLLAAPPDAAAVDDAGSTLDFFRRMAAGSLPAVVHEGGGGEGTAFLCGFLGCDRRPFNPVLAALPRVVHLRQAARAGERLAHLVAYAQAEVAQPRPGRREVLLRLSELMFVEVLRHMMAEGVLRGGLAGLRDPVVGPALAALHGAPAQAWTLQTLATVVGLSRSRLAERFARLVGDPPMRYLLAWRMQLAARALADGDAKLRAIAESVGYDSEAAFGRAFKKHTGLAPGRWRRRRHAAGTRADA